MRRDRPRYLIAIGVVIVLGLASRRYASNLPWWVGAYLGDMLWALMVFLGLGFLFPRWSILRVSGLALAFSFLVEASQLSELSWLASLRATSLGRLVLGYGFLWSDLVCYSIGITSGFLLEKISAKRSD